jgi:predicted MFS family arabinose efflux permease
MRESEAPHSVLRWWVVGACFFISLYTGGAILLGFTAVFEPMVEEFGLSYAQVSLAASLLGLKISLFTPLVGLLADRWVPRRLLFVGAIRLADKAKA